MWLLKKIARKWWVKVIIQKIISFLPDDSSLKVNEWITSKLRGEIRFNFHQRVKKGFDNVQLIKYKTDFEFKDKIVLEIGTGWHGIDLLIFYLLGVKKIYTVDRFPYLTLDNLTNSVRSFDHQGISLIKSAKNRYSDLLEIAEESESLKSFLNSINCEYLIKKTNEYNDLGFDEPIDLFYSESVLQRIPEQYLSILLEQISKKMRDNGVFFHRTDQKDINSQSHIDNKLWPLQYLMYEQWFYNLFINSKLNTQNRLRESDFLEKFKKNNFEILFVQSAYKKEDLELIKNLSLSNDFRKYEDLDLCIRSSKIIGMKGNGYQDKFEREYTEN